VQIVRGAALDRLRHAGRVAAEVLLETGAAIRPGITTDELDAVAHDGYVRRGAYPSTLGYHGYRKSICTSVNEVVCHGIPDDRPLREGDIVNVDVTAYVEGMHGDTSATFAVGGSGALDAPTSALVEATCTVTLRAIAAVGPGVDLAEIGRIIEPFAASRGLAVMHEYGGHGIGEVFHAPPHVHHHVLPREGGTGRVELRPGMAFTIEPMLLAGSREWFEWDDDWTVVSADLLPSAQFEHTVVVTDDGVEIVTVTADGGSAVRWPHEAPVPAPAGRP